MLFTSFKKFIYSTFIIFTLGIGNFSYSQTCPSYLKRNNGNNSPANCGSTTGIPNATTWIKQGSFEFTVITDALDIDKVETYNSTNSTWEIFQDNTTSPRTYNNNIWFGGYSGGTSKWLCFYSSNGTQAPPAANWRFTFKPASDSSFTCNYNINSSGTLPVTWETVSATKENNQSVLKWTTASEQNTKDFVIQHSTNTSDWNSLATIPAAGNSNTTRNYTYTHQNPFKGNTYNYYRILQRDLDSKFSYSKIVSIVFNEPGSDVQVYPNPTNDILTIFVAEPQPIRLINAAGAAVFNSQIQAGKNTISINSFAKGVYILMVGIQSFRVLIK